jgi:oligoendopeptidase F
MSKKERIPERNEIPQEVQWDLSGLYPSDAEWEKGFERFDSMIPKIAGFKGTLGKSAKLLKSCLDFMNELGMLDERLGYYAHLKLNENAGDSDNQGRFARYMNLASRAEAEASYQTPEIQAIPDNVMAEFLNDEILTDFIIYLEKLLRYKPHILSEKEERLLALQIEANQTATKSFAALTDVDMDFGDIETPEGIKPLSQSSYSAFMLNPDKEIRRKAYFQFYGNFDNHKNTLAALYSGSVQLDIYRAKVRNFSSSRAASLFPDRIPAEVYDNLIEVVHKKIDNLHAYYSMRKKALKLDELNHYDVYVPLVKDIRVKHTYDQAVDVVIDALNPLGGEYCDTLKNGFYGGWVDRFENKGKKSGAFSAGSYVGDPYILMNFKQDVLRDVFTLAHEGGHSMHSWYSAKNNPFQHYSYSIFEAEVASTFNEQLLTKYLLERAENREMEAYLIGKQADDIIGTIFRQTMFAEFEHITHKMVESGNPLTVDSLRAEYRKLLTLYFGPEMTLEDVSDLEGLRIPHFYRAFYVYKYATGLSAGIALSQIVMNGGEKERIQYLDFLKSGGSRYPLESLALAGVDMSKPAPVQEALDIFQSLVSRLEKLLT